MTVSTLLIVSVTAAAVVGVLVGVVLGWLSRAHIRWCPACGGSLTCLGCGHRPGVGMPRSGEGPAVVSQSTTRSGRG